MAKPKYGNKRGFSRSRKNEVEKNVTNKRARRNRNENETVLDNPSSPSDSDEQEEVTVYKEPTMYDKLLKALGSADKSVADAYERSCEEEAKSDSDEDKENDLESLSLSDEDEDVSENESESGGLDPKDVQGASLAAMENHSEDEEDDNEDDDEDDDSSIAKESESSSSFSTHMDYKLLKKEVKNLLTKNGKYESSVNVANCKWVATRELNLEDSNPTCSYDLHMKLYDRWLNIYKASGGHDFHSSKQRSFFSLCNSYRDILYHNKKPFYLEGTEEDSNIMDAYLFHSLNHIFKTRDLVTKNDKTLKESKGEELLNSEKFLDQGFTRPKVLILLPIRSIAFRVINRLIQLTPEGHKVNVDHVGRFYDEYGRRSADQENEDGRLEPWKKSKPLDHQALFGGNNDDNFMIGIKFTKKTMKLYNNFYTSDMIVASPLNLILKLEDAEAEKEKDVDYLSSIEVLIIDHADVLAMQNWPLLKTVVELLNHIPSKQHGTDIMRIRPWYLDGQARFYRQSIILASYVNQDNSYLFDNLCHNYEGKVKSLHKHKGALQNVLLQVNQTYERIDTESEADAFDARLDYFKTKHTLPEDISRSRGWFFQGEKKIMLYTERAYFYHRYKIRGIQNLIMYSLPERKDFYPEILNMFEGSGSMNCTVLFTRSDRLRLERIVGTAKPNGW